MSVELQNPIFFTAPTNGIIKYSKKYPFYDINDKRIIKFTNKKYILNYNGKLMGEMKKARKKN